MSVANVGKLLLAKGQLDEAESLFADLVETRRRVSAPDNPWTASAVGLHGQALLALGRADEAEPLLREDVEIMRQVYDSDHPDLLAAERHLAEAWVAQGRLDEAEALLSRASAAALDSAPDQLVTGELWADYGRLLLELDRGEEAVAAFDRAVPIYRELRPGSDELADLVELRESAKP
jgi:tetratricopeptide (TPR) repeat protein